MISSVLAFLWRYETRISCCLASSRERTTILRGTPSSPERSRRTRIFPRDPVPPVTTTDVLCRLIATSVLPRPTAVAYKEPERRPLSRSIDENGVGAHSPPNVSLSARAELYYGGRGRAPGARGLHGDRGDGAPELPARA